MKTHTKLGCYFKVQKIGPDGNITYDGPKFHNVILDSGMDALADNSPATLISTIRVGSGRSVPVSSQTSLEEEVAATSNMHQSYSWALNTYPFRHWKGEGLFKFEPGSVVGEISEVGVSGNGILFNRQLFIDVEGQWANIQVLEVEAVLLYVEFYMYPDMDGEGSEEGSFELEGQSMPYTREVDVVMSNSNEYNRAIGRFDIRVSEETSGFSYYGTSPSSIQYDTYVPGSFERKATAYWDAGVVTHDINTVGVGTGAGAYSFFRLDTPVEKPKETEQLQVTAKRSWGRA